MVLTYFQSIPKIWKAIMIAFLVIFMIRITYPVANVILALFTAGTPMAIASILIYWLIVLFVTWFLLWAMIFNVKENKV